MTVADGGALAAEFALLLIVLGAGLVGSLAGLIGQFRLQRSWDSIDAACDTEDEIQYRLNKAARLEVEKNLQRLAEKQELDRQVLALEVEVRAINAYLAFVMPDWKPRRPPYVSQEPLSSGDVLPMMEVIR